MSAKAKPVVPMPSKFRFSVCAALWVARIISSNLSVTVEAEWDAIINRVIATIRGWSNMMTLHLGATELMADTASPLAADKSVFFYFG